QVVARAAEEFGVDTETLLAEYGPDVPVPVFEEPGQATPRRRRPVSAAQAGPAHGTLAPGGLVQHGAGQNGSGRDGSGRDSAGAGATGRPAEPIRTIPYVRADQEKRAATAQRQLDQLGKVNPLALEEYAALEERHQFLANQLEDLKKTRRDLLTVVKEVDDRV